MDIHVEVDGPYPCRASVRVGQNDTVYINHTELLAWELAIAVAKQRVLAKLPRADWHEVDPTLAGK